MTAQRLREQLQTEIDFVLQETAQAVEHAPDDDFISGSEMQVLEATDPSLGRSFLREPSSSASTRPRPLFPSPAHPKAAGLRLRN